MIMSSRCGALGVAVLLALSGATGRADVRSVDRGTHPVHVVVHETHGGTWTPTGAITPGVLNPDGDLHGDGAPSLGATANSVLVAWTDRAMAQTALAVGGSPWSEIRIAAEVLDGSVPRVVPVENGFVVLFTTVHREIAAIHVSEQGALSGVFVLAEGELLAAGRVVDGIHALAIDEEGRLADFIVGIHVPDPEPIIFLRRKLVLSADVLSSVSLQAGPSSVEERVGSGGPVVAHRSRFVPAGPASDSGDRIRWRRSQAASGSGAGVVIVGESPGLVVAAWWATPHDLRAIELLEAGVGDSITLSSRKAHDPQLLGRAQRLLD